MLEELLHEDDEIMQVWYLLGWSQHLLGQAEAHNSLNKAKLLYQRNTCDQPDLLAHVEELLLQHPNPPPEVPADGEDEEDEEMEGEGEEDGGMDTTS